MTITVSCPSCSTSFPVDPDKVPEGGVHARCSECSAVFFVEKPAQFEAPEAAEPTPEHVASLPETEIPEVETEGVAEVQVGPAEEAGLGASEEEEDDDWILEPEFERETEVPDVEPLETIRSAQEAEALEAEPEAPEHAFEAPEEAPETPEHAFDEPEGAREERDVGPSDEGSAAWEEEPAPGGGVPGLAPAAPAEDVAEEEAAEEEGWEMPEAEVEAEEEEWEMPDEEPEPEEGEVPEALATEETPAPQGFQFGKRDPHDKARRLARVLVSDMIMYNPERHQRALEQGSLQADFDDEIKKSWEEYVEQVGEEIANETSYFTDALNDILAKGEQIFHRQPGG